MQIVQILQEFTAKIYLLYKITEAINNTAEPNSPKNFNLVPLSDLDEKDKLGSMSLKSKHLILLIDRMLSTKESEYKIDFVLKIFLLSLRNNIPNLTKGTPYYISSDWCLYKKV